MIGLDGEMLDAPFEVLVLESFVSDALKWTSGTLRPKRK
jgi:hypothetical protein